MAAFSWPTPAAGPDYGFVEVGYIDVGVNEFETNDFDFGNLFGDFGNFERSGDGEIFSASFGARLWHVFAEYRRAELDDDSGFDQRAWWIGGGWHGLLGEKADLVAEAAYVDAKLGTPRGDVEGTGVRLSAGVRYLPIRWFELNGFYNFVEVKPPAYDDSYEINVMVKLWLFRLGVGYERFDRAAEASVFARYLFR